MKLCDVKLFKNVKVIDIIGNEKYIKRLAILGIRKDTIIKPIRIAPLGDPKEYSLNGYVLAMRNDDAKNILVEYE